MDDPERVRRPQRIGRFLHDAPRLLGGKRAPALELGRDGLAVHVRHHEVHQPVRPFADGVDGDDVRMGQAGRRLRFPQEAQADLLAEGELRRQDLDGDLALEALVPGVEDHAHAAATDLSFDGVGFAERLDQARGE